MSPLHADGLQALAQHDGHEVVHLRELFKDDEPDEVWLTKLGHDGSWIVLSGDLRITTNPLIRKAWLESGLTAFFFAPPWMNDRYWKKTEALVKWFPLIAAQAKKTPRGHGYLMPKAGKELKCIYPAT